MDYIIKRLDAERVLHEKHWSLLYGRRKVGKTFLLRNICRFADYYTVKKDSTILSAIGALSLEDFMAKVKGLLSQNKTVVIDEFQRLNEGIWEELALMHPAGRLVLSGSSLRVVKKIFEPQSPLLGFFTPLKIGFIAPSDIIRSLKEKCKPEKLIELAAFAREPWLIPLYNHEHILNFVYDVVTQSKYTITALIGEIFTEEERELTKKYEAIIGLIGSGIWNTKELTSILYSRKLIPDPSPTHVIQYIKNLEEMELVESIKLYRKKGRYYRLASPIMNIYYYLDSRYDIGNRPTSLEEIRPTVEKLIQLEIQNFIADMMAELHQGRKEYMVSPSREIDFIITKRNRSEIIGEVKWGKVTLEDLDKFRKNAGRLYGKRILIGKNGKIQDDDIEIMLPEDLVRLV